MEERRKIGRVPYNANSVIVERQTQKKYYGKAKNISPLGIAITVDNSAPSLLGKDVIVVAETLIMYADVIREDTEEDNSRTVALSSRKFSGEVLEYLFVHLGIDAFDDEDEDEEE